MVLKKLSVDSDSRRGKNGDWMGHQWSDLFSQVWGEPGFEVLKSFVFLEILL